ncbi:MAG: DUF1080 domain-containing protein [Candidatus Hydrogenedentes bacterium]|nr:DUF1080 domain-containing protein [Candidatus Hydrogenedentota bacterium]
MFHDKINRRQFIARASAPVAVLAFGAIAAPADKKDEDWTPLFNGKDLTGWTAVGGAMWAVEDGLLTGKQGPNFAAGDLYTETEYGDFELKVTFKMVWPGNSGVWFRYQSHEKAYQADILEYKDPECYTGSLYCGGKMFIALQKDPKLEKRDAWNTFVIRAEGDRLTLKLNGVQTADVHDDSSSHGKVGLQVHPGEEFKDMKIIVKEALIRPLS